MAKHKSINDNAIQCLKGSFEALTERLDSFYKEEEV